MSSFSMTRLSAILLVLAVMVVVPTRAARFATSFRNSGHARARHIPYRALRGIPYSDLRHGPYRTVVPFPSIQYKVIDNSSGPGNSRFEKEIGKGNAQGAVVVSSGFVFKHLSISPFQGKGYTSVTLIVESFREAGIEQYPLEVASTVDNYIRVNSDYIQAFDGDVLQEFRGILYHESTHVWQWTGNGQAPIGLVNGIADYVRLKAGYPSAKWSERGSGVSWDEGYEVTAYFLEYCDGLAPGFVARLNAMMKDSYNDSFFQSLLGKSVDQLWNEYKLEYGISPIPAPAEPPCVPGN